MSTAFRAPLAERSAVNRQVLGSIPSGGAPFLLLFFSRSHAGVRPRGGPFTEQTPWRNGSASDSKSEGWGFESLWRQARFFFLFCAAEHLPARVYRPWDQKLDAMAQWQRVGFQIRRLGVRIPLASSTVVFFCVPVAQLDKASDYESEDWGFESLQG